MDALLLTLQSLLLALILAVTATWAARAWSEGLRPRRDPGDGRLTLAGDPDSGPRWLSRATLLWIAGTVLGPAGGIRDTTVWVAVGFAVVTLAMLLLRAGVTVAADGITPAQAATGWLVAGAVVAGFAAWTVLMSSPTPDAPTQDPALAAQAVMTAQTTLTRNAVLTALVVLGVFALLARRSYRSRSFAARKSRRRAGQSTREATRRGAPGVRDPRPRTRTRTR